MNLILNFEATDHGKHEVELHTIEHIEYCNDNYSSIFVPDSGLVVRYRPVGSKKWTTVITADQIKGLSGVMDKSSVNYEYNPSSGVIIEDNSCVQELHEYRKPLNVPNFLKVEFHFKGRHYWPRYNSKIDREAHYDEDILGYQVSRFTCNLTSSMG